MISRDYNALIREQERKGAEFARQAARAVLHPAFGTDSIRFEMAKDHAKAMRETEQRINDLFVEWKEQAAAADRDRTPENRS